MIEIGAFEAKNTFGSLLDRVQSGEEIIITRHGRPVALLISNTGAVDRGQARAAAARIRARARTLTDGTFDWNEMKQDRDEGRA